MSVEWSHFIDTTVQTADIKESAAEPIRTLLANQNNRPYPGTYDVDVSHEQ